MPILECAASTLSEAKKSGPLDVPRVFAWRNETPRRSLPRRRGNEGLSVVGKTSVRSRNVKDGDDSRSVDTDGDQMHICNSPSAPNCADDKVPVTKYVDKAPSIMSPSELPANTSDVDQLRDEVARLKEQLAEREGQWRRDSGSSLVQRDSGGETQGAAC